MRPPSLNWFALLWIACLVLLAGALAGPAQASVKTLKYDDGKDDSKRSVAGDGHAVLFASPSEVFTVTGVQLHGSQYGGGFDPFLAVARVSICDRDLRPHAQAWVPYSAWPRGSPAWVKAAVQPCLVSGEFLVVVEYFPTQTKGIYQSIDASSSGHSFLGTTGNLESGGNATRGERGSALADGEWMIRVEGETKEVEVDSPDLSTTVVLGAGEGEPTGTASIAGSGHGVRFQADGKKNLLTRVSICGSLYGGGYDPEDTYFHVFVCDKKLDVLARSAHPYSLFAPGEPAWVDIDLPAFKVPKDFYLLVLFDPSATRGVYVGKWKEKGGRSLQAYPGKPPKTVEKGTGWMIKATLAASAGKKSLAAQQAAPGRAEEGATEAGLDAMQIAALVEELDAREKSEDVKGARKIIEEARRSSAEDAERLGWFDESDHFILRRQGMADDAAAALLRLMEAAHEALTGRFGFERVSAVPGKKIHLHVTIEEGSETALFTSPSSPEYSLIVLRGGAQALRSPTHGGPHVVYGFCHELGHVLIGFAGGEHEWAHYLGSMLVDDVQKKLGAEVWVDSYDASGIEGMAR
ncbi:MAG: hypothetical protein AB1486_35205, partial [Planctomycetota bacterium]